MLNKIKRITPSEVKKQIKLFYNQVKLFNHHGNKYTCPFCGYSSKDLKPIGFSFPVLTDKQVIGAGRRNAGCYKCGSTDRERLIYIFLKKKLGIFNNAKDKDILHIAPKENLTDKLLEYGFNNYICGDLFAEGYNYPRHVVNLNVLNLPFRKKTFDLVICNHVLEHIPNDSEAMHEIFRVLKIGGQAILQVPISKNMQQTFEDFSITDPKERELTFGQYDHFRIYGQDYEVRLRDVGFEVTKTNISNEYLHYGLNPHEDIFIARK